MLNDGIESWFFPLLLIPLYQLLLFRCFRSCSPSMLWCIGTGLFTWILGFILLQALGVYGVIFSDDVQRYLSCTALAPNATNPGDYIEWYWKCDPSVLYGLGSTIVGVLVLELIIAQLPEKMKGLVIGIMIACRGFVLIICVVFSPFTLCYDLSISLVLVVLFVVFLVFSKHYTLRERNREINIQAIVEEHYERYMDQEEEYIRENPRYFESLVMFTVTSSDIVCFRYFITCVHVLKSKLFYPGTSFYMSIKFLYYFEQTVKQYFLPWLAGHRMHTIVCFRLLVGVHVYSLSHQTR